MKLPFQVIKKWYTTNVLMEFILLILGRKLLGSLLKVTFSCSRNLFIPLKSDWGEFAVVSILREIEVREDSIGT